MGRPGARAATLFAAALLLAACGEPTPGVGPTSATPSDAPSTQATDLAVEAPGPLTGALEYADMLVFNTEDLSEAMVAEIADLPGVEAVEVIGLGQVMVEDRALNVAAVDPATYRRFTPQGSAQAQVVWERVAGGEVAATRAVRRRLDGAATLSLGSSTDSPQARIGAWADQVPQVDLVVNRPWGERLDMALANAVVVSSGRTSPQALRPRIERIVGDRASIQVLGPDLDTSVQQTAFLTGGSVASLIGTFNYQVLGGGRIAPDPAWVAAHISVEQVPVIGTMRCHRAMFPQLRAALQEVVDRGLADRIHASEYAGCYHPRFIANTTKLSNHSFGTAFDINVPGNQRGTVGEIDRDVVAIFKKWGFAWGGDWSWTDPMHFEMNAVVEPR